MLILAFLAVGTLAIGIKLIWWLLIDLPRNRRRAELERRQLDELRRHQRNR